MVSNFKMTDQPKPSTSPPSVKGLSISYAFNKKIGSNIRVVYNDR